jgi:hypothetical protein
VSGEPNSPEIVLVEQDGIAHEFQVRVGNHLLTVITNLEIEGRTLLLRDFHVDGPGPGQLSATQLRKAIRALGQNYNVTTVVIRGFERTTGANPGHTPRPIVVRIES